MRLTLTRSTMAAPFLVLVLLASASAGAAGDPHASKQWGLRRVAAEAAWASSGARGAGVTIAIVDTGVDLDHPDLKGAIVPGYDFVDDDTKPDDENGHGTHVAGIAAARAGNGIGVAGAAPEAKIMPIRVLAADGRGSGSDVEAGVRWAVDHGADVVNLSLSGGVLVEGLSGGTLTDLVEYAWDRGAVPVIAAGNGGLFRTDPASAKRLLVTATDDGDRLASYATSVGFADRGLAAPGGDSDRPDNAGMIYSTHWTSTQGSGYGWAMGTSMAAPLVSGAAAILRGLGLDVPATVARILESAEDIGSSGHDFNYGAGLLDIEAAVDGLVPRPKSKAPAGTVVPAPADEHDDHPSSPRSTSVRPASTLDDDDPAADTEPEASARAEITPAPSASAEARVFAAPEGEDGSGGRSAAANVVLASTLLAVAGGLVGYGGLRRRALRGTD